MLDSPPPTKFTFKEPVAVLLRENTIKKYDQKDTEDRCRFIKLPNVKTAKTLSEAKTLVNVHYSFSENMYYYGLNVFDIDESCLITQYHGRYYEASPPGLEKIIEWSDEILSYPKFASDHTDCLSVWRHYLNEIDELPWNGPDTEFYRKIYSKSETKTFLDTSKLSCYDMTDVKGYINIDMGEYKRQGNDPLVHVSLSEYSYSLPQNESWLVVITTFYERRVVGLRREYWAGTGKPTGRPDEPAYKEYYNKFVVDVAEGRIIMAYSGPDGNKENSFDWTTFLKPDIQER